MGLVETFEMGLVETWNGDCWNINVVSRNMFQLTSIHDQLQLHGKKSNNSATRDLTERCCSRINVDPYLIAQLCHI